jgi:hypothetical protein
MTSNYGPVTIRVTHHDINCGMRKDCQRCPVANAIRRVLKDGEWLEVEKYRVTFSSGWVARLPEKPSKFIESFDFPVMANFKECPVEPFEFKMNLPFSLLNDAAKAELGGEYAI